MDFDKLKQIFESQQWSLQEYKVDDWTIIKNIATVLEASHGSETLDTINDTHVREQIYLNCIDDTESGNAAELLYDDFINHLSYAIENEDDEDNDAMLRVYLNVPKDVALCTMKRTVDYLSYNHGELFSQRDATGRRSNIEEIISFFLKEIRIDQPSLSTDPRIYDAICASYT